MPTLRQGLWGLAMSPDKKMYGKGREKRSRSSGRVLREGLGKALWLPGKLASQAHGRSVPRVLKAMQFMKEEKRVVGVGPEPARGAHHPLPALAREPSEHIGPCKLLLGF